MPITDDNVTLNDLWERRIKDMGADFVCFVDAVSLPSEVAKGYACAVLFGKALSREYIAAMKAGEPPKHKEVFNTERKMDALADKLAELLTQEGYESVAKLKTGLLPHKTVALRAGLGFIGKNNLLVTPQYGCALMLGKVLTTAPFTAVSSKPMEPKCGDCTVCVDVCPTKALLGRTWDISATREEIITRKQCTLCLSCMTHCPFTDSYVSGAK